MPFTPNFSNLNTATGNAPTAQQLGEKALKANLEFKSPVMTMGEGVAKLTGSTSLPAPSTTSTPTLPSSGAPPLPSSGNTTPTPTSITPTAQLPGVLSTAKDLAREDEGGATVVRYVKGPDGVVRPTIEISGARIVDDSGQWAAYPTGGPGAPPPMPAPEPTAPPLVRAPPTQKKTSPMLWLGLALAAAVLLD